MSADVHIVARATVIDQKDPGAMIKTKPFSVVAYTSCNLENAPDKPFETLVTLSFAGVLATLGIVVVCLDHRKRAMIVKRMRFPLMS